MSRNCLIGMSKSLCDNCVKVPDKPQNALKMEQTPALMTPHEVAILKRCEAALAEPPRECDMFVDEKQADALHEAFIEYCNGCDCPMGCVHRKDPRFLLDTNCASIMKCFARFALSKATPKKACAR